MGQIGVLAHRFVFADQPAQLMHPDAEMPFLLPAPRAIKLLFKAAPIKAVQQLLRQCAKARPWRKEPPVQHRIQHIGIARQIARQARRGGADIDDQINQRRIGLEQRKQLNTGWQATKKAVEIQKRLIRACRRLKAAQQIGLEAFKDRVAPFGPQRGIGGPARHDLGLFGGDVDGGRKIALAGLEQIGAHLLDAVEPRAQPGAKGRHIALPAQTGQTRESIG